ncbi:SNF2 family N-terminal domain-containing protein, partial [Baffinella frigidus]
MLATYDVVLTTYSIVQSEFSAKLRDAKISCKYCGKKYLLPQMKIHHKFWCGPTAQRSVAQAKQEKRKGQGAAAAAKQEKCKGPGGAAGGSAKGSSSKSPNGSKGGSSSKRKRSEDSGSDSDFEVESEEEEEEEVESEEEEEEEEVLSEEEEEEEEQEGEPEESEEESEEDEDTKKAKALAEGGDKRKSAMKNGMNRFKEAFKHLDKKEWRKDSMVAKAEEKRMLETINLKDFSKAEEKRMLEELQSSGTGSKGALLHGIKWHRIAHTIKDKSSQTARSAHTIKDKSSQTARSVFALDANYRWALSGTPLQNRVSELFSLIRFLQVDPYAYYYDKQGQCKQLNWDMGADGKTCSHCGKHRINHFCWWNKHVMNPICKFGYAGEGRVAMRRLKHEVLDKILLRRTKEGRSEDIVLPPKIIILRKDTFDPFELDYYQSLYSQSQDTFDLFELDYYQSLYSQSQEIIILRKDTFDTFELDYYQPLYSQSQTQFNAYVSSGTLLNNYAHIFDLLIRLRQAVNHPYLVQYSEKNYLATHEGKIKEEGICCICSE